jgi:membrane protein
MWNKIKTLFIRSVNKAIECDIVTQGAAIAFYTIFSVAPLLILVISLASIFYSEELISGQVSEQLEALVGTELTRGIQDYMEVRRQTPENLFTTIIAVLMMVIGATTVINQLKYVLNMVWEVKDVHIHSVWQILINRLISFGVIILLSVLLLTSLLAESILSIAIPFFQQFLPEFTLHIFQFISQISTIIFASAFFTLVFKILPDVNAPWKDIMTGAIFTTILFLAGKYLVGIFLTATGIDTTYKAAGSLVIFIIWVYYNIQIVLFGAILTQVYTSMFGGEITPYRFVSLKNKN